MTNRNDSPATRIANAATALEAFTIDLDGIAHDYANRVEEIRYNNSFSLDEFGHAWDTLKITRSLVRAMAQAEGRAEVLARRIGKQEQSK
jgi:hypothetical protein